MAKDKRKIYKVNLWLCSDDVKIDIDEYTIKRKGESSIQTEEGEVLYTYDLDNPSDSVMVCENSINVSLLTEDLINIDKEIERVIEAGRKRVDLEMSYLNEMHEQLNSLKQAEDLITLRTRHRGWFYVKNSESSISLKPWLEERETIPLQNYINNTSHQSQG